MVSPNLSQSSKKAKESNHSVPHKSVIRGKFPAQASIYPKPAIFRINMILACFLGITVILSMMSYLGVIAKENKIKDLHFSTNKINYENIELQNKVDYLKSFYTIDDKVQKIDFLKKPDKVMEVEENRVNPIFSENRSYFDVTSVPGF